MSAAVAPRTPPPLVARIAGDAVATLAAVLAVFAPKDFGGVIALTPVATILIAAAVAVMVLRRQAPRLAAAAAVILTVVALLVGGGQLSHLVAVLVTVFTVARSTDRRWTILTATASIVTIWLASLLILGAETTDIRAALLIVASIGFAAAAGDAGRSQLAYIAEITDRAQRAEQTREAEARRRIADDRMAIARDLHDLVAHQIAVVSLNAGVASRALRERPDDAERALRTIHGAAQAVLGEIHDLLTVLRESDGDRPPLAPSLGLAALPQLAAEFQSSGLVVDLRTGGTPRTAPPNVDAVAYRAVQEALTNALKHGSPKTASVLVDFQGASLEISVANPVERELADSVLSGHGLRGMRERVAAVRGRVTVDVGGEFRLVVWLPLPARADA